jgi:hypothetical protein
VSTNFFKKEIAEAYDIAVNFTDRLDTGRSVSSCTVTALDLYDNSNASTSVLDDGTASVSANKCTEGIKAGANGHMYKLTFKAVLDNSDVLEDHVFMFVED